MSAETRLAPQEVGFFVFDVETVANGELIANVRYPGDQLSPQEAIRRYRDELLETHGSDFIPYTYQIPASIVIAKVRHDFRLGDIVALDQPRYRPHVITEHFWRGWESYGYPTFVSFNGRSFDMPLMELAAFQFGVPLGKWFDDRGRSFEQPRYRYNSAAHLDLQDLLVNFGASRFHGGLNLAANLLGKPGKMTVQGDMVQDMFDAGKIAEINDYCRCDVLDTYFVFLRSRVLTAKLSLDQEQEIVAATKEWLLERADESPAYQNYLDQWNDWPNPWQTAAETEAEGAADSVASAAQNAQSDSASTV